MDLELSVAASPPSSSRDGKDDHVIVTLRGECDLTNADVLRERLLALLGSQTSCVILDLAGLTFIDSSGLTALVVADRRARELGGTIVLAGARKIVARVLSLTALDKHFPVYATVAEALAGGQGTEVCGPTPVMELRCDWRDRGQ